MPIDRLVIANFATGFETDRTPFIINNDAFPTLENAYEWRGRLLRKRAARQLGRLQVNLALQNLGNTTGAGTFSGNILTILGINVPTLAPDASIVLRPIVVTVGPQTFTQPSPSNGTLIGDSGGSGTINYATGGLTLTGAAAGTAVIITFGFYPNLPVLGFEDFDVGTINQPLPIAFDNRYSYGFNQGTNVFFNANFYKNTGVPFNWTGEDFQQFWSTNYLGITSISNSNGNTGCLWATNFEPGFHFITIASVTIAAPDTPASVATIVTTAPHNLTNDDFVFINEVAGVNATAVGAGVPPRPALTFGGVNGASAQVTFVDATTFTIPAPYSNGIGTGGIVQYLTRSTATGGDGIRWYDGDPAGGAAPHTFGWVNFAPPLTEYNTATNPNPQYLVGAKMIVPFKNRLLFFGVYLRTSAVSPGVQFFPNRMVYSQVGTPFYSLPLPFILNGQLADPTAYFQNVAGKGGFLTAYIDEEIVTVDQNGDILICGYETQPLRLLSTGDDTLPFFYQTISSELGAQNTFSSITLDVGSLYIGVYGIALVTQESAQRIDLQIPDTVFEIASEQNKSFRVTAVRDFQKEFIYFTYCQGQKRNIKFPNQTLLYNYREHTWAIFQESYTRYGTFRRTTNRTWANINVPYPTWSVWNDPWDFGSGQAFFPTIVGGNQQGFVMEKGQSTNEAPSQYISAVSLNTITSPDHGLLSGDFVELSGLIGITNLNNTIQQIRVLTPDTFSIETNAIGTYLGGGVYKRLSRPFIQTKQFPIYWKDGRGVRVGTQRFLLDATSEPTVKAITAASQANPCQITSPGHGLITGDIVFISGILGMTQLNNKSYTITVIDANNFTLNTINSLLFTAYISGGQWTSLPPQITVNVYSSQNPNNPSNLPSANNYLSYSNIVLTCAEPENLYSGGQSQIWHRSSNSFNGDTIQLGFTLSDDQMRQSSVNEQDIVIHAIVLDLYPGPMLS